MLINNVEKRLGLQIPELPYSPDFRDTNLSLQYPRQEVSDLLGCVSIYGVNAQPQIESFYRLDRQLTEVEAMHVEASIPGLEVKRPPKSRNERSIGVSEMATMMTRRAMAMNDTDAPLGLSDLFSRINIDLAGQQWPVTDNQTAASSSSNETSSASPDTSSTSKLTEYFNQLGLDFDHVLEVTGDLAWSCFNYGAIVKIATSPAVASYASTYLKPGVNPSALRIIKEMFAVTVPITHGSTSKTNKLKAVREVYPAGFFFADSLAAETSSEDYTREGMYEVLVDAVDSVRNLPARREKVDNLF